VTCATGTYVGIHVFVWCVDDQHRSLSVVWIRALATGTDWTGMGVAWCVCAPHVGDERVVGFVLILVWPV
jgi:hypothetical protein